MPCAADWNISGRKVWVHSTALGAPAQLWGAACAGRIAAQIHDPLPSMTRLSNTSKVLDFPIFYYYVYVRGIHFFSEITWLRHVPQAPCKSWNRGRIHSVEPCCANCETETGPGRVEGHSKATNSVAFDLKYLNTAELDWTSLLRCRFLFCLVKCGVEI